MQTDRRMDGQMDGQTDRQADRLTDPGEESNPIQDLLLSLVAAQMTMLLKRSSRL